MTDAEAKVEAEEQVRLMAETACPPDIEDELLTIVERHRLASTWVASTAYRYGDVVQPTVRNGRWYRCMRAGTSAATEPVWSVSWTGGPRSWVSEGATLGWCDAGYEQPNIYDIRAAIHEAWMLKAAKATHLTNVSMNGTSIQASDAQKQFRERAAQYMPIGIAV